MPELPRLMKAVVPTQGGGPEALEVRQIHVPQPQAGEPAGMPLDHAAALPEALFTFWFNVVTLGRLKAGEWLLIHGGSSGVGSIGIQVAKWRGAHVITTSGTEEKRQACLSLGADHALTTSPWTSKRKSCGSPDSAASM